jgi:hypothetical protein
MRTKDKTNELRDEMYLALGSSISHDRWVSFSRNEALIELFKPDGFVYYGVSNLKEASELTRLFIDEFGLRASNWTGGRVCDANMNFVARVSYNGRIWDSEDWTTSKEIQI